MALFTKTVQIDFHAFQFHAASEGDFGMWDKIDKELPNFSIYAVDVMSERNDGDEIIQVLYVTQRWYNNEGERSCIPHRLTDQNWLVEDSSEEGGYKVLDVKSFVELFAC